MDEIDEMRERILDLARAGHVDARGIPPEVPRAEFERKSDLKAARCQESAELFRRELRADSARRLRGGA